MRRTPPTRLCRFATGPISRSKRRINRLEYRPGAYLNEAQISRQLKIGRTPVHQALDRLMLEGLVQIIPRKGVVVQ